MRHGALPTRRGGGFFALFQAKRGCHVVAMSRWKPNATWRLSNTTWRASFCPFFELKVGVLPQPRRVGSPIRRGAPPTRHGGGLTHP